jgi:hypothetical protein
MTFLASAHIGKGTDSIHQVLAPTHRADFVTPNDRTKADGQQNAPKLTLGNWKRAF